MVVVEEEEKPLVTAFGRHLEGELRGGEGD